MQGAPLGQQMGQARHAEKEPQVPSPPIPGSQGALSLLEDQSQAPREGSRQIKRGSHQASLQRAGATCPALRY